MAMGTTKKAPSAAKPRTSAKPAETATAQPPQNTAAPQHREQATVSAPERRDADRVAMVSRRADGTPDQSEGFEVIGGGRR